MRSRLQVERPLMVRWDSSSPERPFLIKSQAMPGKTIKVWRTDGYGGPVPKEDWLLLENTVFKRHQTTHINNAHSYGYTRYDVVVVER